MTNLQTIKDKIEQAHDFKNAATGVYRKWQDGYYAEVNKIRGNRNLTDKGKFKLKEKMSERKAVELMQLAKWQINEYKSQLDVAYKEADRIANTKPKAADPVKAERFEKSLGEVKAVVMMASPDKVIKILQEFVDATEEPALVDRIRAEFAAVIAPVIGQAKPEQKDSLTGLFEHTQRKAKGAEVLEAEQLRDTAQAMRDSKFFGLSVIDCAKEVHPEAQKYLNNPDAFLRNIRVRKR